MDSMLTAATAYPEETSIGTSRKRLARVAGTLYLTLIVTGIFGMVYVPATLVNWEDPAATVSNIQASESLFRIGIASVILCQLCFLGLALTLFELFRAVNIRMARYMLALAVAGIPAAFAYFTNYIDVLSLVSEGENLSGTPPDVIAAHVMLSLSSFSNGYLVTSVFSGLWLFPLGVLVYQSGFLPRVLGVLLVFACFGYVAEFIAKLVFAMPGIPVYISILSSLGEFGMCLWLLVFGVRDIRENVEPERPAFS